MISVALLIILAAPDPFAGDACVTCHRDEEKTRHVYEEWLESIHYENQVSCSGCHGGDASVPVPDVRDAEAYRDAKDASHLRRNPEFLVLNAPDAGFESSIRGRSVSYFCGRCHTEIMEKHLGSPHGDFGSPTCLYCHGTNPEKPRRVTHAIQVSTLDIIDTRERAEGGRCSGCHTQAAMKVVHTLKELLTESEVALVKAGQDYEWLLERGYRYLNLGAMVENSQQTRSRVRASFHSFNMREIQDACKAIDNVAKLAATTVEIVDETEAAKQHQTLVGVGTSLALLLIAGVLVYYRRRYCATHALESSPNP